MAACGVACSCVASRRRTGAGRLWTSANYVTARRRIARIDTLKRPCDSLRAQRLSLLPNTGRTQKRRGVPLAFQSKPASNAGGQNAFVDMWPHVPGCRTEHPTFPA